MAGKKTLIQKMRELANPGSSYSKRKTGRDSQLARQLKRANKGTKKKNGKG